MEPAAKILMVFRKVSRLMGNQFEISVVADDETWALERIEEAIREIRRIEKLLTTYDEQSETNRINQAAGISPVQVSAETVQLIQRAIRISDLTPSAFGILMPP